jgi:hypothetical protein
MVITKLGFILLPLIIYVFVFKKIDKLFNYLIIFAGFTAASVINIPSIKFSILPIHLIGGMFVFKICYSIYKDEYRIPKTFSKSLFIFIIVCGISLIYPLIFNGRTVVITPNSEIKPLAFSGQNLTQYIYLVFAYLMYINVYIYIINTKVDFDKIINLFKVSLLIIIFIGILQIIVPVELYNDVFKANYNKMTDSVNGIVRISSVTQEASMLSLFTAPLSLALLVNLNKSKQRVWDVFLVVATLIVSLLNASSTYFVNYIIFGSLVFLLWSARLNKGKLEEIYINLKQTFKVKKNIIMVVIMSLILILVIIVFRNMIMWVIISLIKKLQGQGESGSFRKSSFLLSLDSFKKFPLTGVGFGSVRSFDLFSTWIASIGLMGMIPFIFFITKRLRFLYKNRSVHYNYLIFALIFNTVFNLFISVPEPYYIYIWIYFALGDITYKLGLEELDTRKSREGLL